MYVKKKNVFTLSTIKLSAKRGKKKFVVNKRKFINKKILCHKKKLRYYLKKTNKKILNIFLLNYKNTLKLKIFKCNKKYNKKLSKIFVKNLKKEILRNKKVAYLKLKNKKIKSNFNFFFNIKDKLTKIKKSCISKYIKKINKKVFFKSMNVKKVHYSIITKIQPAPLLKSLPIIYNLCYLISIKNKIKLKIKKKKKSYSLT